MHSVPPEFQFDRRKFTDVVLFIISICAPERLGSVKLHKILYFADMLMFASEGHPMTGSTYRKRPHGPTSDHLLSVLRELERGGDIRINATDYFGFRKTTFQLKLELGSLALNDKEKEIISDVTDFVANQNTAKTISEFSHNRAWEIADFGAVIPYYTAFALFPAEVSSETIEWAKSMAGQIEIERSGRPTLDYDAFATLRRRVPAY